MSQSLSRILVHPVFSTKVREPLIDPDKQVRRYIEIQAEHHCMQTFQDEFRELLRRHGMEWDERYVWDRGGSCRSLSGCGWSRSRTQGVALG